MIKNIIIAALTVALLFSVCCLGVESNRNEATEEQLTDQLTKALSTSLETKRQLLESMQTSADLLEACETYKAYIERMNP